MDESKKNFKPTMENTNPFHWEMQLLAQEFNEREARQVATNDNYLTDQVNLREHNCNVAQLEEQKHLHMAILDSEQESEIDLVNKKYTRKFQELENNYIKKRDDLERELFNKSGKSYKKLQKLHSKNLSQSQEFERKAKDILQRMASSLREENTICVLDSVREVSTPPAVVTVETPPFSPASGSTAPVSQIQRVIQNQYLETSSSIIRPFIEDERPLELRVAFPYVINMSQCALSTPTSPAPSLDLRPSAEIQSTKRQKTNDTPSISAKNVPTSSKNGASNIQDILGIHIPTQSSSIITEETFDSHVNSMFSSMQKLGQGLSRTPTSAQDHNVNRRTENSTAVATNFPNKPSYIKTSNRKPTMAQASAQYIGLSEIPDVAYPNIRPASIESRVSLDRGSSAKHSGQDFTRTQATTQYHNATQRTRNVSAPIVKAQYHTINGESGTLPNNGSMPLTLLPNKVRPAHSPKSLSNNALPNSYMDFPPAFAQIESRRHVSLQTTRPLKRAPEKLLFKGGSTGDVFNVGEAHGSDFSGQNFTPSKRKASDINKDDLYEDIPMMKNDTSTGVYAESEGSFNATGHDRASTNPSRLSNTEQAQRVIDTSRPSNTRRPIVAQPSQQGASTPSPRKSRPGVVSTPKPINVAPTRSLSSTVRRSVAESQLSAIFFTIEFMSYDPGSPSKCYPVSWSSMNGSHNYRLQLMKNKKNVLHPYDGFENKASLYPKLVIDDSWVLGGFFHKKQHSHRLEIYRPRSKKEYNEEEEKGIEHAKIECARMRIKFTDEAALDRFLEWYSERHPDAEIRPNDLLGQVRDFLRGGSKSDKTLRREIENRAERLALAPAAPVAPFAPMTSA